MQTGIIIAILVLAIVVLAVSSYLYDHVKQTAKTLEGFQDNAAKREADLLEEFNKVKSVAKTAHERIDEISQGIRTLSSTVSKLVGTANDGLGSLEKNQQQFNNRLNSHTEHIDRHEAEIRKTLEILNRHVEGLQRLTNFIEDKFTPKKEVKDATTKPKKMPVSNRNRRAKRTKGLSNS